MPTQVIVPVKQWLSEFRKANFFFLKDIGEFIENSIKTEIERTWDTKYRTEVLVNVDSNQVVVVWGAGGDPPAILNEGGDLTARFPSGFDITPNDQVSKTVVGQLRSVQPIFNWVNIGVVIGSIIARDFDSLLIKDFIDKYDTNAGYNKALRLAGIT